MNITNKKGFVGVDIAISIVAIVAFSGLIFSLMYHTFLENAKIKKAALATIYLTEVMEKVGIAAYEDITQENVNNQTINLIPAEIVDSDKYHIEILVSDLSLLQPEAENIAKRVKVTINYTLNNIQYQYALERIKTKE